MAGEGASSATRNPTDSALTGIALHPLPGPWSYGLQPCALAAGISIVLMLVGLHPLVAALATGFLAVVFGRRRNPAPFRTGAGASLGALSGVMLFFLSTILETLAVAVLHKGAEMRSQMIEKVQQAVSRYPSPDAQSFLDFVKTPNGFTTMLILSLVFGFVAFTVLGSLGGMLGAAIFRRRD